MGLHVLTIRCDSSVAELIKQAAQLQKASMNQWCVNELAKAAERCLNVGEYERGQLTDTKGIERASEGVACGVECRCNGEGTGSEIQSDADACSQHRETSVLEICGLTDSR